MPFERQKGRSARGHRLTGPRNAWLAVAFAVSVVASTGPASASDAPGAEQIQFAAREHDLGYRAYLDKQFDEAATHFENAFFAAPNPAELRSAIRARRDAGELARAATLAAIGLRRFPDDAVTAKAAADVITLAQGRVYEIKIASPAEYSVAVDSKIVAAERVKESRIFVTPGAHELLVSWSDDRDARIAVDAREGESETLQLDPPQARAAVPPPPVVVPTPPAAVVPPSPPAVAADSTAKPLGPAAFVVGAALTAAALGLTVWSGIDAENNPGVDAVRASCRTGRPECSSLYNQGRDAQLRTNVLIAATGTLAAATAVVGVFFTAWSTPPPGTRAERPAVTQPSRIRLVPSLGIGRVGLQGTF